jgi:cyclophilin family peptidyl-prolyl cis-trans isomerase
MQHPSPRTRVHAGPTAGALACLLALSAPPAQAQAPVAPQAPAAVLVRFATTAGSFTVELDAERAPLSTANFVQYVRDGHYDGTMFHRVISGFVVQGGGYLPDATEKPTRGPVPNESGNGLSNRRGTVALARQADPHSADAQFYVNLADNYSLDPSPSRWGYAVVGRVVEGMETVDRIAGTPTGERTPFGPDVPLQPIVIQSAQMVAPSPAASPDGTNATPAADR